MRITDITRRRSNQDVGSEEGVKREVPETARGDELGQGSCEVAPAKGSAESSTEGSAESSAEGSAESSAPAYQDFHLVELAALPGEPIVWCRDRLLIHKARQAYPGRVVYLEPEIQTLLRATENDSQEKMNQLIARIHRLKKKMSGWIVGMTKSPEDLGKELT